MQEPYLVLQQQQLLQELAGKYETKTTHPNDSSVIILIPCLYD